MINTTCDIWAGHIPYFDDGSFSDNAGHRVAMGLIDVKTVPSSVYSFGYYHSLAVVKSIVGHHGITPESMVIDNTSRRKIGTVAEIVARDLPVATTVNGGSACHA
jgi:hypothetical protein